MNARVAVLGRCRRQIAGCTVPIVTAVSGRDRDPFLVLISCLLSLRTQDRTTAQACARLFGVARTPGRMSQLSRSRLSRLIYPVAFYRVKAGVILRICRRLIDEYSGKVPASREALLGFSGVGPKTANLVRGLGFGIPAICVDTHVHRISNRLGWVRTRTPEQTERALEKLIPRSWWIELNTVLVTFGQHVCLPVSPRCSVCGVRPSCRRRGVQRCR